MSVNSKKFLRDLVSNRLFIAMFIVLVVFLITSGFVSMQTEQTIAPPGLRVMDSLWRLFFV